MKKRYTLNGKNYNVDVNSQAGIKWLENNPTAVLVGDVDEGGKVTADPSFIKKQAEPPKKKTGSTESATEGPKTQAQTTGDTDLSSGDGSLDLVEKAISRFESYTANEEQVKEAESKANAKLEELNYLSTTNYKQIAKDEEAEEGFFEGIGTTLSAIATFQTESTKRTADALEKRKQAKKERRELYSKAFDSLLEEENKKRSQEERILKTDEEGNLTEEYNAWVNATRESGLADAKAKAILQKQYEDEYFDENIEKSIEERTEFYNLARTDSQLEEEKIAKQAIEQLNEESKKIVKSQNALVEGLATLGEKSKQYEEFSLELNAIGKSIEKITSKEYTTEEEYNKAQEEYNKLKATYDQKVKDYEASGGLSFDQLNAERERYMSAYARIEERSVDIIKNEEDLKKYVDAVGRNYNFFTNFYGAIAQGAVSMAANYSSFVSMVDDMIDSAASNLPESIQGNAANAMRLYAGPLSATLLANKAAEGVIGEDTVEEVEKALYGYTESISNYLEAPPEFSEISNLQDAGEWYAHMVASQAANTAVTVSTGGASLFVLGATSAGAKYHDLEEEMKSYAELPDGHPMKDFKYSKAQQYTSALLSGTVEGLSEKISLGQLNKVKGLVSSNAVMKRGFNNFLYRNFATTKGLYNNFYDPIEEGASELASQFGSNVVDRFVLGKENSLLEGLDESFVSGLLMSGTVFKAPAIGKNIVKAFQSTDVTAELERISADLLENSISLQNEELTDEVRADLEAEKTKLVNRHSILMQETIRGYENMSKEDRNLLIDLDVNITNLRKANKNLEADASLSQEEAERRINRNNEQISDFNNDKQIVLSRAASEYNVSKIQRSTAKAQKDLEAITGKPVKVVRANSENIEQAVEEFKQNELQYYDNEISKKQKQLDSASAKDKPIIARELSTLKQDRLDFESQVSGKDVFDADGFIASGTGTIFINETKSVQTGSTNVANHEFLHAVLKNTIADNPAAAIVLGDAVRSYLDALNPDIMSQSALASRLRNYQDQPFSVRSEEMITLFADALASGDIKIETSTVGKLKNAVRDIVRSAGVNKGNIKLNTAKDVVDFIVNFQNSRNSIFGFRRRAAAKNITEGLDISEEMLSKAGDIIKADEKYRRSQGVLTKYGGKQPTIKKSLTNDVTNAVDELGNMGWDNDTWKEQGANYALGVMQSEKMLDRLIASKLKVPMPPNETKEFIAKVYSELTSHVKNFRPDDNDSLFGWINSQISNKAGNVYNREYKATEESRGVDIDAKTSDGKDVVQIAADTDYEMARIDEIGLDEDARDDYSRLRRDLGLNEEMMDKVKKTVMKVFGTKLPQVDSKKFKSTLEKAFRSELKKPIQDMMGGREDYDMFLVDHFAAVFRALPASTLVSMEKNVDPDKRIFTTSERITKPTEVDRLVSEGRLPKDVNRLSGPQLHTKKPMPDTRQVLAYFRGKNMKEVLGYEVGASTLGTRKDKLAMEIGVELAFDATSDVLKMEDVRERRKGIAEIQGYEILENDVAMVAKAIDRDPTIKFSFNMPGAASYTKFVASDDVNIFTTGMQAIFERIDSNFELWDKDKVGPLLREEFISSLPEKTIETAIKRVVEFANQWRKVGEILKSKNIESKVNVAPYVEKRLLSSQEIGDIGMFNVMGDALQAEENARAEAENRKPRDISSISSLWNDDNVRDARAAIKIYYNELVSEYGEEVANRKISLISQAFSNSSTIGPKSRSIFEGKSDFIKVIGADNKKFEKNRRVINKQSAAGVLKDKNYDGRDKLAEESQEFMTDFVEFMVNKAKDPNSSITLASLAMIASGVNGTTNGAMRTAAKVSYIADGYANTDLSVANKILRYEHVIPVSFKFIELYNEVNNHGKVRDRSDFWGDYKVAIIPKSMDNALNKAGLRVSMPVQYGKGDEPLSRYYNSRTYRSGKLVAVTDIRTGEIIEYGKPFIKASDLWKAGNIAEATAVVENQNTHLISFSKTAKPKGMSVFDFDETLIIHGENFIVATRGDEEIKISSGDWPLKGPQLAEEGWEFDFSDFVNVRGGEEGPLLQKMKNQIDKFGNKNVFVLTARPAESALPIYEWLKSKGVRLPYDNITGLGDGRGEAKAAWMLNKYHEGYNDMYFVDDALPNVEAVQKVIDDYDIKGKSVQAMIKFSKTAGLQFEQMLERNAGVKVERVFSRVEARIEGKKKGRYQFFVPPSAEDFKGLIYKFVGSGKQGDADLKWFEENLFKPFSKGIRNIDSLRQAMSEDYASLRSEFKDVTKRFKDEVPGTKLNVEQAIRVYLWASNDIAIPGLDLKTKEAVMAYMKKDQAAAAFAGILGEVSRAKNGYVKPKDYWIAGNIGTDLMDQVQAARKLMLKEWRMKKKYVFSDSNLNKIEAIYGTNFRSALDDILWRMEHGTNRPSGKDANVNKFLNWINGSVGAVMFFNMRSAVLQTMSAVNYINFEDNNIFKASAAFANQKQYWADVVELFNSDTLKQRRAGLKIDVSASELASTFENSGNKISSVIAWFLEKGFKPTQIADSIAIATGGATFYRNRINTYIKKGDTPQEAQEKAFADFQELTEENQQSSRPDLVSQQQASVLGRLILAWQNTPMQYTRLTKKALSDLVNRRGDWKANVSKILYYGFAQNVVFGAIQSGLMFMMFGGEEDEEEMDKKNIRVANGVLDTLLRGTGVYGAAAATAKNVIMRWYEESQKDFGKKDLSKVAVEMVNLSPPIGSKVRKVMNAIKTYDYSKDVMKKMDYSFNNPGWDVLANLVEATTNAPMARIVNKAKNVELALSASTEPWQKVALLLGWNKWDVGVEDVELEEARGSVKEDKAKAAQERREARKEQRKEEKAKEKEKEKEEKKEAGIKEVQCSHIKSDGSRCKVMVETDKDTALCQYHRNYDEKVGSDLNNNGVKEFQCTATTSSGKRCKNRTENKNKRCYAHQ